MSQLGASQLGASQASQLDGYQLPPSQLPFAIPGLADRTRGAQGRPRRGGGGDIESAQLGTGYGFGYGDAVFNAPATQLSSFQQARLRLVGIE